jgi:ABC-type bacteriocin/lantibiotic exporter with double-glycine peptidase domain
MITALISTLTGLISGTVPNLLKEWGASREHKRELEMLTIQTDLQLKIAEKQGETRVAEMDREVDIAAYESQAKIASASLVATGIAWVDAWNGALRPFAVTIIITLFAVMASFYTYAVLTTVDPLQAVDLLWGSLIGEAIQAVLGFLFGYRSARK